MVSMPHENDVSVDLREFRQVAVRIDVPGLRVSWAPVNKKPGDAVAVEFRFQRKGLEKSTLRPLESGFPMTVSGILCHGGTLTNEHVIMVAAYRTDIAFPKQADHSSVRNVSHRIAQKVNHVCTRFGQKLKSPLKRLA